MQRLPCPERPRLETTPSWISQDDLVVARFEAGQPEVVISSGQSVMADLVVDQKKGLPPTEITSQLIDKLQFSVRSCLAQSGLFLYTCEEACGLVRVDSSRVTVRGRLQNHGPANLRFKVDQKVGRFFWANPQDKLVGLDLEALLSAGLIKGEIGSDYMVLGERGVSQSVAIRVALVRHFIPQERCQEPLFVNSRQDIYNACESGHPFCQRHPFHLVEAQPEFRIPQEVMGVLSERTSSPEAIHLPSHLIDPGSFWKVRLEILGGKPAWVVFDFYRSLLLGSADVQHKQGSYAPSLRSA